MELPIYEDAFNLLCGKLLGEGIHRKVFECRLLPRMVVKVEYCTDWRYFSNVHEMKFWNDASPAVAAWLAPCQYLSPDGRILIQRRADPIPQGYELPLLIPSFLSDIKRENFGLVGDRLVCLDYPMTITTPSLRLKKANWESES